jgi:hypothetical protein
MKKINSVCFFIALLICTGAVAQKKDSVPVKPITEKASSGDIILGKENKKQQLNSPPQLLERKEPLRKKTTYTGHKKRKCKHKN